MKHPQPEAIAVLYGGAAFEKPDIVVERVAEPIQRQTAQQMLRVMGEAYQGEFGSSVPEGTIANHFSTGYEGVTAQVGRVRNSTEQNGATYWLAYEADQGPDEADLLGLIKVSPSYPHMLATVRNRPNCYVNDIAVAPDHARNGLGSMMLHAALRYGGYRQDASVVADTYALQGSGAKFFGARGFQLLPDTPPPTILHAPQGERASLDMERRRAKSLGGLVRQLERSYPQLAGSGVLY